MRNKKLDLVKMSDIIDIYNKYDANEAQNMIMKLPQIDASRITLESLERKILKKQDELEAVGRTDEASGLNFALAYIREYLWDTKILK